jgi:uncharacterized membrane protein YagU involved in acid resistance
MNNVNAVFISIFILSLIIALNICVVTKDWNNILNWIAIILSSVVVLNIATRHD